MCKRHNYSSMFFTWNWIWDDHSHKHITSVYAQATYLSMTPQSRLAIWCFGKCAHFLMRKSIPLSYLSEDYEATVHPLACLLSLVQKVETQLSWLCQIDRKSIYLHLWISLSSTQFIWFNPVEDCGVKMRCVNDNILSSCKATNSSKLKNSPAHKANWPFCIA